MNCSEAISDFLADYVDATLPPETLADFEHHLDVCASCRAYLVTYRATIAMARSAERAPRVNVEELPEELVQLILSRL
jgi:anti-sigma factor RsiW